MKLFHPIIHEDLAAIVASVKKEIHSLEGKNILVTGGSGFLGKYIIDTLLYCNQYLFKEPCHIISIDNHITSDPEPTGDRGVRSMLKRLRRDVSRPIKISKDIHYIIHAAGIASPRYYRKYPLKTIDVAVIGTRNMLNLAVEKKAQSIVFFSSSEIYGDPPSNDIPTKEIYKGNVSSIGPRSCYDESKRLGEALCVSYYDLYKVPVKITRPFNIYGPGMRPNDYRVIPTFVWNALKGKSMPLHSKGEQTRAFCYISDATSGFLKILLSKDDGEVYNVGNDKTEVDIKKLAQTLNNVLDDSLSCKNAKYPDNYPLGEPKRRCPDITKISSSLGFVPIVDLHSGLKRTVAWCRDNWDLDKEYDL